MIREPVLMARYLCSRRYCCAYNDVLPLPYRCALAWRSRTRLEISLRLFQHFASCEHGLPRALRGEKAQRRRIGNNGCDDCEKAETVRALHRKVPQVEQDTRREWPRRAITQRNGLAEPFDVWSNTTIHLRECHPHRLAQYIRAGGTAPRLRPPKCRL